MALRNNTLKYGSVAKLFHWLVAILIISLIIVGLVIDQMSASPQKLQLLGLHKSFGITVLSLAFLRFAWKLSNVAPLLPFKMGRWEKYAAHAGHALLYFFMFAMPLSGWFMSSAAGYTVSVFGWFTMPNVIGPNQELRAFFSEAHEYMAFGLIAMITLHVFAALLHHFYYKDNVLLRMLPHAKLRKEEDDYSRSDTMVGC